MHLSPSVLPPGSGPAIWEACVFPPLWGWLCGTLMAKGCGGSRGQVAPTLPCLLGLSCLGSGFPSSWKACASPAPASLATEGKFLLPPGESIIPSSTLPEGALRSCFY